MLSGDDHVRFGVNRDGTFLYPVLTRTFTLTLGPAFGRRVSQNGACSDFTDRPGAFHGNGRCTSAAAPRLDMDVQAMLGFKSRC
jgi:hypothetical protein